MSSETGNHVSEGATKIIDRIPKAGQEQQLEAAISDIIDAMRSAYGLNSVYVVRPSLPHQPAYRVICTFDSDEHLKAWEASDDHVRLVTAADEFTAGEPQRTWLTGLETWFTLPVSANAAARPPAYKMAITTYIALLPTIHHRSRSRARAYGSTGWAGERLRTPSAENGGGRTGHVMRRFQRHARGPRAGTRTAAKSA